MRRQLNSTMQSSSDARAHDDGCVEQVQSRDGPSESRYVFLAVFAIALAGAVSLFLVDRNRLRSFELPIELTGLTTQLSNARVELQILMESGILPKTPDLAALKEAELPPFERQLAREVEPGCFLFDLEPYLVRFRESVSAPDGWEIAWLDEREVPEIGHALHIEDAGQSPCEDHNGWQDHNGTTIRAH